MVFNIIEVVSIIAVLIAFLKFLFKRFDTIKADLKEDLKEMKLEQKYNKNALQLLNNDMIKVKIKMGLDVKDGKPVIKQ